MIHWIKKSVDKTATVQSIVRLKGSTSSILHHVCLLTRGSTVKVVVHQFNNKESLHEETDLVVHEAHSLHLAEQASDQPLKIIAYDETDEARGIPALLMTTLAGDVNLKP